jgi:hypothetical protein
MLRMIYLMWHLFLFITWISVFLVVLQITMRPRQADDLFWKE